MNCAHHPDAPAVMYCRTCGKALCANCTRPVRGVVYCEDCLGQRMEAARAEANVPAAGFVPAAPPMPPPVAAPAPPVPAASGPNPAVAGILAGFFPFGVGAVYTGQYAKGLAHMVIFGLLMGGAITAGNHDEDALVTICVFGLVFFWVYQIIDAVRSAKAIQVGLPAPDPYGLAATFGGGAKVDASKVPVGAIVLILLGVLFLLHTMGIGFGFDRFWPLLLIFLGAWLFARNLGLLAPGGQVDACCKRSLVGPALLATLGLLFLIENFGGPRFWHSTWPIVLLVIGGAMLLRRRGYNAGGPPACGGVLPPQDTQAPPPPPPAPPASSSEVNRG